MPDADETLNSVEEQIQKGDITGSYETLKGLFSPLSSHLEGATTFARAVGLLAQLSKAFGAADLSQRLQTVALAPDDVEALYEAAYGLYEERQHEPAATLLIRANRLLPGQPNLVAELSGNLEKLMLYAQAADVLDESGTWFDDPICTYLSGFNSLMCGRVDTARTRLQALSGVQAEPLPVMRDALAGMLARVDALQAAGIVLNALSLTAWQAAVNGTLLLHESPHGYEEAMRGRYAYLSDSSELMQTGLSRLKTLLEQTRLLPSRVVAAPDRSSQILALAAAEILGVPCVPWSPGEERVGLIIAHCLETSEDGDFLEALRSHQPGSMLFVHACSWTAPYPQAPDITTLLYQHLADPWSGGRLQEDPETGDLMEAPPDLRDVHTLAQEILNANPEHSQCGLEIALACSQALSTLPETQSTGIYRNSGLRLTQRAGGPVLSNHF